MEIKREDLKDGQQVWACAYTTNNTEKSMAFRKKPVLGVIKLDDNYYWCGTFYELCKDGKIKKSSAVKIYARHYANTEEESKEIYNNLVQAEITLLEKLVEKCKKDLI